MADTTKHGRLRAVVLNLFLLGATTLVALLVAEGALRFVQRTTIHPNVGGPKLEPDTLYGWVKRKDFVGRRVSPEFDVEERFNSRRIRGPEYPVQKPDGEYRILLLGDSFAEGYTVEFEQVLSEVAKRRLNERLDVPVQVINSGTAGWSTDQELLWFREEGLEYQPDLVVLLFYVNDISSNASNRYWRGYKPFYEEVEGAEGPVLELRGVPVPAAEAGAEPGAEPGTERTGPTLPEAPGKGLRGWLSAHSRLYRDGTRLVKTSEPLFRVARALRLTKETDVLREDLPIEWASWHGEPGPRTVRGLRMSRLLIKAVEAEARQTGAEFLLVHAPSVEAVHDWAWENAVARFNIDPTQWKPGAEEDTLRTICREEGIPCLFLGEPFERALAQGGEAYGEDLYWRRDRHWNALGNRIAGEAVADHVIETILGNQDRQVATAPGASQHP